MSSEGESNNEAQVSEKYDVFDVACSYCGKTSFGVLLKPNTTHRIVCPECKHTTYVRVLEDLSIQMYKEDEACQECHGTGYVTCPKCGGDGYLLYIQEDGRHRDIIKLSEVGEFLSKERAFRLELAKSVSDRYWSEEDRYVWKIIGCLQCGGSRSYTIANGEAVYFDIVLNELGVALTRISKGSGKVKCSKCGGIGFVSD